MKHFTIPDIDDITAAKVDAKRNVTLAKLSQFEIECLTLGGMVQRNPHRKREVVDCLYDIATANDLLSIHGGALIEDLIAVGLEAR
ncbi:hypothetical protein [Bradyrhizobium sp. AUGA SZCCT0431]|uniref:hypothetical protein n=1 Tax=Bradyrhizobium sp. AUGA SZCCT0431 TaxID=2807674 RepID=UPI001BA5A070|nr:hypothetical protein [Bradyrhizobium sp. AUGA SZCCT0431]MBR1145088.1 hypothetical protein [Bradyrhizobium sp. AUGA SZCCT0431]